MIDIDGDSRRGREWLKLWLLGQPGGEDRFLFIPTSLPSSFNSCLDGEFLGF